MDLDEIKERITNLSDNDLKKEGIEHISDYRDDVQILYKIELKKRGLLSESESNSIYVNDEEYIKKVLSENNLIEYFELFKKEKILSLEILSNLSDTDYEKIGIKTLGDIKTLQKLFKNTSLENANFEKIEKNSSETENAKKSKAPLFLVFIVILLFGSIFAIKEINSVKSPKQLTSVQLSLNDYQLIIKVTQTVNDVRIRINSDYLYEEKTISPGTYSVGVGAFTDKNGNRFDIKDKEIKHISFFCKEGSTGFTPK